MLTDDDRTPLAGLEVVGYEQHAEGDDVVGDVEDHLVALPFRRVVRQPCPRVQGHVRFRQSADDCFSEFLAKVFLRRHELVERFHVELVPHMLPPTLRRRREQPLGEGNGLFDLALLSSLNVDEIGRFQRRGRTLTIEAERLAEAFHRAGQARQCRTGVFRVGGRRYGDVRSKGTSTHRRMTADPLDLRPKAVERGRRDPPRRRAGAAGAGRRRRIGGHRAMLQEQWSRRDHAGELRVAEVPEQAPDVALDRLLRNAFPGAEVPRDDGRLNSRIERTGVKCEQSSFEVTEDGQRRRGFLALEPIDRGQHLLQLVADDMPAHFERLAIDELAVRLVGPAVDRRCARIGVLAVNQGRDQNAGATVGQPSADLGAGRNAIDQADEHFRRLSGVGNDDDVGLGRIVGFEQQSLAVQAGEHGPADVEDFEPFGFGDERRRAHHHRRKGGSR